MIIKKLLVLLLFIELDDKDRLNRYLLAKEFESRPDAGELEFNSKE